MIASRCITRFISITVLFLALNLQLEAQLRVHSSGKVTMGTVVPSGSDKLMIQSGYDRGLLVTTNHKQDWWQSVTTNVSRPYTVSYVVRWNNRDRFYVTGEGSVFGRSAWWYSDEKLKEQIKSIESPIQRLSKINGVSFVFRKEELCKDCGAINGGDTLQKRQYGIIAQEVEQVFPEMVMTTTNGLKAVSYQQLIPVLIEALKDQQKVIESLQLDVEELKKKQK